MFRMKAGIELRRFRREAMMMPIRPYLIYVAAAGEPLAESTSKWSKTKKKHRNVKLNAYKKKLIEKDGRKRRKMNSCDKKNLLCKK